MVSSQSSYIDNFLDQFGWGLALNVTANHLLQIADSTETLEKDLDASYLKRILSFERDPLFPIEIDPKEKLNACLYFNVANGQTMLRNIDLSECISKTTGVEKTRHSGILAEHNGWISTRR